MWKTGASDTSAKLEPSILHSCPGSVIYGDGEFGVRVTTVAFQQNMTVWLPMMYNNAYTETGYAAASLL
jgi:hypothetical protein